jgi:hypothetical protein
MLTIDERKIEWLPTERLEGLSCFEAGHLQERHGPIPNAIYLSLRDSTFPRESEPILWKWINCD